MQWDNPIPVAVVLLPVRSDGRDGLLVIRRANEPGRGKQALVGGFVEAHERWQVGAAREVNEETGIDIAADALEPVSYVSSSPVPNRILMFCRAPTLELSALPPFAATDETCERGAIFGPVGLPELFAFPLHVDAAVTYFASRDIAGPADYRTA